MRSWCDIKTVSQGNILEEGLDRIWQTEFTDYRFSEFKCCKDQCKNKCFEREISSDDIREALRKELENGERDSMESDFNYPTPPKDLQVVLYGVINPLDDNNTYVYGVQVPNNQPQICMYAVMTPDSGGNYWTPNSVITTTNAKDRTYYGVEGSEDIDR